MQKQRTTDERMETPMARNETRAVISRPTGDKHPDATRKSPIKKTCCNAHLDADWTWIQQTLPGADPILLYRLPQMHLRPLETDTQSLTTGMQTPPTPTQRITETNQTTPPDLAEGDAYRKRTQSDDWVPDGNRSGDTDMDIGSKNGG